MLADIPVDYLKLDRSFLLAGLNNNRHVEVMRCIINLAKTLNIEVIAEGIETQEQADFLCSLGCRYAQGYLYSKPSPADTFLNLPKKIRFSDSPLQRIPLKRIFIFTYIYSTYKRRIPTI